MRITPREVCSRYKSSFILSRLQKDVLVGTLLGDGGLRFRGNECRLHIKHGIKQLSLVNYKWKIFADITTMKVNVFSQAVGKNVYQFAEFVTLTHPEFTKYYRLFYTSSRKVVPSIISQLLVNPISLAVWFMDDGSADYAGASLQTHSFTKEEVEQLMETIRLNFRIETTKKMNKGKWVIYFPKASMSRLQRAVEGHLLEDFKYKLIPYSLRMGKPRRDCTPESVKKADYDTVRSV